MSKPYFVKAKTSGTWHIIYPGENRPICGTTAVLDDMSGSFDLPGDELVCATCQWSRRLRNENVRVAAYYPEFSCVICGAVVTLEQRRPHYHRTIYGRYSMSDMDEKKIKIDLMRWCETHQSRMDGDLCLESLYEDKWDSLGWEPCKAVWIEKPTPVEVSDE